MEELDMEMVRRVWARVRQGFPAEEASKTRPLQRNFCRGYSLEQMLLVAMCLKCMKK